MARFYVSRRVHESGNHKVHTSGCPQLPNRYNRIYLGNFHACQPAVQHAYTHYRQVDGCYYCCRPCHMDIMTLTGASRNTYDFQMLRAGIQLVPGPGCYAFTRKAVQDEYPLVYIGETGDLSERFDNHHKARCIQRNGATLIGVHRTRSKAEAQRVEWDVLRYYTNVPCNEY